MEATAEPSLLCSLHPVFHRPSPEGFIRKKHFIALKKKMFESPKF